MKLSALKSARQIEKEGIHAAWATLWYYYAGWLPNQIEILWLRYKTRRGRWVPVDQSDDDRPETGKGAG